MTLGETTNRCETRVHSQVSEETWAVAVILMV
jgi:hypothetical protein